MLVKLKIKYCIVEIWVKVIVEIRIYFSIKLVGFWVCML